MHRQYLSTLKPRNLQKCRAAGQHVRAMQARNAQDADFSSQLYDSNSPPVKLGQPSVRPLAWRRLGQPRLVYAVN